MVERLNVDEIPEARLAQEKAAARELRKSRWWQNRITNACVCYYCGVSLKASEATMDHIVPLSRGGRSIRGNVAPACKTCNTHKRDLTAIEWETFLTNRKKEIHQKG